MSFFQWCECNHCDVENAVVQACLCQLLIYNFFHSQGSSINKAFFVHFELFNLIMFWSITPYATPYCFVFMPFPSAMDFFKWVSCFFLHILKISWTQFMFSWISLMLTIFFFYFPYYGIFFGTEILRVF